jgi:flavodoxin/NAD-dependent dihydropyrimidine dehydrogenase PreA subunit
MNVKMILFSQTGNTQKVGQALAMGFEESGHSAQIIPLKKATPEDTLKADLLGIGTPCFANQAPTPVKNFLYRLPALDNRLAFVFCTSGGCPGMVLYDLTRLLRKKGAKVLGGILIRGETRHPAPCIKGRNSGRPTPADLGKAQLFAAKLADHVSSGQSGPFPESRPEALAPRWGFYDLTGYMISDRKTRFLMPKPKLDQEICNQCQWCVDECPISNISLTPFPTIGDQCIRCYRCLTGCPREAFKVNWWVGNLVVWSLYNTAFERWFGDIEPGE